MDIEKRNVMLECLEAVIETIRPYKVIDSDITKAIAILQGLEILLDLESRK